MMTREKAALSLLVISLMCNALYTAHWYEHSQAQSRLPYLSKRLFADKPNDILINFVPLRRELQTYIQEQQGTVGVYFEYLPSGVSIGANANHEMLLSSLAKVPLAMSILKKVERGELSLSDRLTIREDQLMSEFGDLWKQGAGTTLTIDALIRIMLQQSDNTAYKALFDTLTYDEITEVYENLDVELLNDGQGLVASPKSYSSILRSLYLASFLTKEDSNYILTILTTTPFNDKIAAGVPESVPVAHKIGVYEAANTEENVLIDCGIVYVPQRPYILCAFDKDNDEKADEHISHISALIYDYIASAK